jgi:hypothetical protein
MEVYSDAYELVALGAKSFEKLKRGKTRRPFKWGTAGAP